MFELVPFAIGAFIVMVIDIAWWQIDYKKAEKGMEAHEHYHLGLELLLLGMIIGLFNDGVASLLYGMGFLFLVAEWRQAVEIVKKKVVPGHPFAFGSTHFKQSTIIGIILLICNIFTYIYLL